MPPGGERNLYSRKTARVVLVPPNKGEKSFTPTLSVPIKVLKSRDNADKISVPDKEESFVYDDPEDDFIKKHSPRTLHSGAQTFRRLCKKYGRIPTQHVLRQFGKRAITLESQHLTPNELKAFFVALVEEYINKERNKTDDDSLDRLDMTGNRLEARDMGRLTDFMEAYKFLNQLILVNCHLCSESVRVLADALQTDRCLNKLDLSDNSFTDAEGILLADIIRNGVNLRELVLRHNRLSNCGTVLGDVLADNDSLFSLDLSWNHIRGKGATGLCKGLTTNNTLETLNVAWNGFGYEGAAAMGHALQSNTTLQTLDLSNNRIHPPALFELLRGLEKNKALSVLKLGQNPITTNTTSLILQTINKCKESNLRELDLQGIIVDKDFESQLEDIQKSRLLIVRYDHSLPLNKGHVSQIDPTNIFNIDPVRILYIMKEHLKTIDLFLKVDKNHDNFLSKDEIKYAFEMEGFAISEAALEKVMSYLDTNKDGEVDLLMLRTNINVEIGLITECIEIGEAELREFINGERRLKRNLIKEHEEQLLAEREEKLNGRENKNNKRENKSTAESDQKFSQAFTNSPRKLPPLNRPKMA